MVDPPSGLKPENVWAIQRDLRFPPEEVVRLMCRQAGHVNFRVLDPNTHRTEYEWAIQHAIEDCRSAGGYATLLHRPSVLMKVSLNGTTSERYLRIVLVSPKDTLKDTKGL